MLDFFRVRAPQEAHDRLPLSNPGTQHTVASAGIAQRYEIVCGWALPTAIAWKKNAAFIFCVNIIYITETQIKQYIHLKSNRGRMPVGSKTA